MFIFTKQFLFLCRLDKSGNPCKINFSNASRDSFLSIPFDDVQPFYDALCKMEEILTDKANAVVYKLNEGMSCLMYFIPVKEVK